jgi:iron complex transport system substrate-binding protein
MFMMIKGKYGLIIPLALLTISLAACSDNNDEVASTEGVSEVEQAQAKDQEDTVKEQTITYLDKEYVLPEKVNNIVAASLESMEDAAILGLKPVGVLEIGGEIPSYLAKELEGAELVGDKFAPNNESILALDPDVILGSSKHGEDVVSQLNKIQTMIHYSHISTNWKENLRLLG